jgi:hypothetical protein
MLQLMLQPTLQLMPRQTLRPTLPAMLPTMQLMLPTSKETLPRTQGTIQKLNLLQSWPMGQKEANVTA